MKVVAIASNYILLILNSYIYFVRLSYRNIAHGQNFTKGEPILQGIIDTIYKHVDDNRQGLGGTV